VLVQLLGAGVELAVLVGDPVPELLAWVLAGRLIDALSRPAPIVPTLHEARSRRYGR
jgi:hypothetical protein